MKTSLDCIGIEYDIIIELPSALLVDYTSLFVILSVMILGLYNTNEQMLVYKLFLGGEMSVIVRFLFLEMVRFLFLVMLHVWSICIHRLSAF